MKKKYLTIASLVLISSLLLVSSCRKFVQVDPPINQVLTPGVFASDAKALSALSGLYAQMVSQSPRFANGGLSVYAGLSADELVNSNASTSYDAFALNNLTANLSSISSSFWSPAYTDLYHANALIEGVEKATALSEAVKKRVGGEARFVRAFYFFYLGSLFGPVPLVTGTDYRVNEELGRKPVAMVYDQVVKDLTEAIDLLPDGYAGAGKARPNRLAAQALLARVYLYGGEWAKAEAAADAVIASGVYALETPEQVFLKDSKETLWGLEPIDANTAEGALFIPSSPSVIPPFVLRDALYNCFENGDLRKTYWVGTNTVGGTSYAYPYKYQVRDNATVKEINILLRLAEVYLVRAEALLEQDQPDKAVGDLNMIRERAGLLPLSPGMSKEAVFDALVQERRVELFAECGHRWLDLKRWKKADAVLGGLKPGYWQPTDSLYPIPQSEIQINPALEQNEGY